MNTVQVHFSISESKKQANAKLAFANILNMETTRIKRLRKLISEDFDGSQTDLSKKSGVSLSQLGQYLSGYRALGEKTARKIELACGKEAGWLDSDDLNSSMPEVSIRPEINLINNPEYPSVKRVKLHLSAGISGFAIEMDEENHVPLVFGKYWYQSRGFKPEKLIAVRIKGASMEPGMGDGDTVVINTADTTLTDGEVFAVNYEGEAVVKRLVRDAGEWWLSSDNPDQRRYSRKLCSGDACIIIGRIVHKQSERI